jgi:hypothetical protein
MSLYNGATAFSNSGLSELDKPTTAPELPKKDKR